MSRRAVPPHCVEASSDRPSPTVSVHGPSRHLPLQELLNPSPSEQVMTDCHDLKGALGDSARARLEDRQQNHPARHPLSQKEKGPHSAGPVHILEPEEITSAGITSSCPRSERVGAPSAQSSTAHENPRCENLTSPSVTTTPSLASSHAGRLNDVVARSDIPPWSPGQADEPAPQRIVTPADGYLPISDWNNQERPPRGAATIDISRWADLGQFQQHTSRSSTQVVTEFNLATSLGLETLLVPIDMYHGSKEANGKRARNARASARFRTRREAVVATLQQRVTYLQQQVSALDQERNHYRTRCDELSRIIVDNGSVLATDLT